MVKSELLCIAGGNVKLCSHCGKQFDSSTKIFFKDRITVKSESEVAQSCPTLWDPMDCSLPGSSLHGILQARVLEWGAIAFSRGSSRPRDRTRVSCIPGGRFNLWATTAIPLLGIKIIENRYLNHNLPKLVHNCTYFSIHNSQRVEIIELSINGWINK